jgi:magnesium transporter
MKTWITKHEVRLDQVKSLSKELLLQEENIQDALDVDELSRVEATDDYYFVIVRAPIKTTDTEYRVVPIGIFITETDVITVCSKKVDIEGVKSTDPVPFILYVLQRLNVLFIRYLKRIDANADVIRLRLQTSANNEELLRLFDLEKSLVVFETALKSNQILIRKLRKFGPFKDDLEDLDDVEVDLEQALSMATTNSGILSNMMDAYASCISNNLNVVIKRLTVISIVMMVPTFIVSFWGMNVGFPKSLTHTVSGLIGILVSIVVLTVVSYFGFMRKDLFKRLT